MGGISSYILSGSGTASWGISGDTSSTYVDSSCAGYGDSEVSGGTTSLDAFSDGCVDYSIESYPKSFASSLYATSAFTLSIIHCYFSDGS